MLKLIWRFIRVEAAIMGQRFRLLYWITVEWFHRIRMAWWGTADEIAEIVEEIIENLRRR